MLSRLLRQVTLAASVIGAIAMPSAAPFAPFTFSTTGVFGVSGTNVANFTNINGTTTITFNGTTNPISTPAGASFGDIVETTTVPANLQGPALASGFTLNVIQVTPAGSGSFTGTLSGTLGFNKGIALLTFSTNAIGIGTTVYTVNPTTYSIPVPVSGVGGGAGTGTMTLGGSITAPPAPEGDQPSKGEK